MYTYRRKANFSYELISLIWVINICMLLNSAVYVHVFIQNNPEYSPTGLLIFYNMISAFVEGNGYIILITSQVNIQVTSTLARTKAPFRKYHQVTINQPHKRTEWRLIELITDP